MPQRCGAKTRIGGQCEQFVMHHGTRCRMHGGSSPNALAKAAERGVTDDARKAAVRLGVTPIVDPLSELLSLAGEVKALKDVLAERANDSTPNSAAFERSIDRLHKILADLARLDIEQRLARISESQVERMVESLLSTIQIVVEGLGHDSDDPSVRAIVTDALRRTQMDLSAPPDPRQLTIGR